MLERGMLSNLLAIADCNVNKLHALLLDQGAIAYIPLVRWGGQTPLLQVSRIYYCRRRYRICLTRMRDEEEQERP